MLGCSSSFASFQNELVSWNLPEPRKEVLLFCLSTFTVHRTDLKVTSQAAVTS